MTANALTGQVPKPATFGGTAEKRHPRAGKGAKQNLLGTTKRRSGRRQVTYAGHPLYT